MDTDVHGSSRAEQKAKKRDHGWTRMFTDISRQRVKSQKNIREIRVNPRLLLLFLGKTNVKVAATATIACKFLPADFTSRVPVLVPAIRTANSAL